jgi:hypothetical protein
MVGLKCWRPWLVSIILGISAQASACPVCGVGRDGTAPVYLMTAVLMSLVPLVMAGAMVYYLCWQTRHDRRPGPEQPSQASPLPRNAADTTGKGTPDRSVSPISLQ